MRKFLSIIEIRRRNLCPPLWLARVFQITGDFFIVPSERRDPRPRLNDNAIHERARAVRWTQRALRAHERSDDGGGLPNFRFARLKTIAFFLVIAAPLTVIAFATGSGIILFFALSLCLFLAIVGTVLHLCAEGERHRQKLANTISQWSCERDRLVELLTAQSEALSLAEALWIEKERDRPNEQKKPSEAPAAFGCAHVEDSIQSERPRRLAHRL